MKQLNTTQKEPLDPNNKAEWVALRRMQVAIHRHSHIHTRCTQLTSQPRCGTGKKGGVALMLKLKLSHKIFNIFTKGNTMKKSSTPQEVRAVGMVWYHLEDYSAILRIMTDSAKLPRTFHEWLMQAEANEKKLRRDGHTIVRIFVDPKTFPDWCSARSLNVDAQARMLYASTIAKETHGTTH